MKRLRKILLIALGVIVLLLVAAVVSLNLYLRSPGNRARISDELSRLLHMPLQINKIAIGLHGTEISGLQIPENLEKAARLDAKAFTAKYRILPLLQRQFIVESMVLDSPTLVFQQNEEGKFAWPKLPERLKKPKTDKPKTPKDDAKEDLQVLVDSLVIKDGSVVLWNLEGQPVAHFDGVQMNFKMVLAKSAALRKNMKTIGRIEGTIAAQKIGTPVGLTFEEVRSSLVLDEGMVSLPDFRARLAGGSVQATMLMPVDKKVPTDLQLELISVDLARVAEEARWKDRGLTGGTVNAKLKMLASLKALKKGEGTLEGTISSPGIRTPMGIVFENVSSSAKLTNGNLTLPDFRAKLGGGDVQLDLALPLDAEKPFDVKLNLTGTDLAQMLTDAGGAKVNAAGMVKGKFAGRGTLKDAKKMEGEGELTIADGEIRELALVQMIALLIGYPELADLRIRTGKAGFRIADERVQLEKFALDTSDLRITSNGTIEFDGDLKLKAKLGLSQSLAERLERRSASILNNFDPKDEDGRRYIGFNISGKADRPKTDLGNKLITGQLIGLLQDQVFGEKKKDKEKDKQKEKEKEEKRKRKEQEAAIKAAAEAAGSVPPPAAPQTPATPPEPVNP